MPRYLVRVWLADFEVEADLPTSAEEKAAELIDGELSSTYVELAEAQKAYIGGNWKYIDSSERN